MEHVSALLIKFIMTAFVLGITLGLIGGASFSQVLITSAIVSIVAYIIGDLAILPAAGNWVATIADAGLVWITLRMALGTIAVGAPLLYSIVGLAIGEYFFHAYMKESVLKAP